MGAKEKANVLVIGNSGAGKSTLINSIFGENKAETGLGQAVTDKLQIYENSMIPFRMIDTIGFEFGLLKQWQAIHAVQKWSKDSINKENPDKQIDLIWYCVEATSKKLFGDSIEMLSKAVKTWKDIPTIVVLTKSYSIVEREENIRMVYEAFAKYNKSINLKAVIPVVAQSFMIDDNNVVAPQGIVELIEETNKWAPEGISLGAEAVKAFIMRQKNYEANALVASFAVAAGAVAAVPIPLADATLLSPMEMALVTGIEKIYGISKKSEGKKATNIANAIVNVGTVSIAAKGMVSILSKLNPVAAVANVIVASTIVASIGEITITIMKKIYAGEIEIDDLNWIKSFTESELSKTFASKVNVIIEEISKLEKIDIKDIPQIIINVFSDQGRSCIN